MIECLTFLAVHLDADLLAEAEEEEAEVATQAGRRPWGEPLLAEMDLRTTMGTQAGRSPWEILTYHIPHHRLVLRGVVVEVVEEAAAVETTYSPPLNVTIGTC